MWGERIAHSPLVSAVRAHNTVVYRKGSAEMRSCSSDSRATRNERSAGRVLLRDAVTTVLMPRAVKRIRCGAPRALSTVPARLMMQPCLTRQPTFLQGSKALPNAMEI
jgi:hypothetical protein